MRAERFSRGNNIVDYDTGWVANLPQWVFAIQVGRRTNPSINMSMYRDGRLAGIQNLQIAGGDSLQSIDSDSIEQLYLVCG